MVRSDNYTVKIWFQYCHIERRSFPDKISAEIYAFGAMRDGFASYSKVPGHILVDKVNSVAVFGWDVR